MHDSLIDKVAFIYPRKPTQKIRGIVIALHGLGNTQLKTECTPEETAWANVGILIVDPALGPWAWMNPQSQRFIDELLDDVKTRYSLQSDIPIIPVGGSMGGHAALLYSIVSRHKIAGCRAWVPVCDLLHHYSERPDLPRTMHVAFGSYGDITETLVKHSPLHQSDRLRDVPYYICQGDQDAAVNKEMHGDKLVKAMRERKLNVTYREVPGAKHDGAWPQKIVEEGTQFVISCAKSI